MKSEWFWICLPHTAQCRFGSNRLSPHIAISFAFYYSENCLRNSDSWCVYREDLPNYCQLATVRRRVDQTYIQITSTTSHRSKIRVASQAGVDWPSFILRFLSYFSGHHGVPSSDISAVMDALFSSSAFSGAPGSSSYEQKHVSVCFTAARNARIALILKWGERSNSHCSLRCRRQSHL